MTYEDYKKCDEILRKNPQWFFKNDYLKQQLECLQKFEGGDLKSVAWLVLYLPHPQPEVRKKTLEIISSIVGKIKSQNHYWESLKYLRINKIDLDVFKKLFNKQDYTFILTLATFNSDGYVREKAIKELQEQKRAIGIKYLLLRMGDWVKPVRETAEAALKTFFTEEYIHEFLKELCTIEGLKKVQRVNLSASYDQIIQFVLSQKLTPEFYHSLQISEQARLIYVRSYLRVKGYDTEIGELLSRDRSFLIRRELIKIIPRLESEEQTRLISKLLSDTSSIVRLRTLYAIPSFYTEFENRILELTSDESASVRNLARFVLRNNTYDFNTIYSIRIGENKMVAGSILGLSEIESTKDLGIYQNALLFPDPSVLIY